MSLKTNKQNGKGRMEKEKENDKIPRPEVLNLDSGIHYNRDCLKLQREVSWLCVFECSWGTIICSVHKILKSSCSLEFQGRKI